MIGAAIGFGLLIWGAAGLLVETVAVIRERVKKGHLPRFLFSILFIVVGIWLVTR